MTDLSEEIKDLERSAAYNILEELYRNGSLSKAEMDLYKSKYAKLHEMVIQTFENEQNFVTRAKQLNQRLMQEKIKLEKTTLESQEDQNCIEQLLHQKFEIEQEYQVAQDREMMLQIQLSELDHDRAEKQEQLREREIERQAEAEPKLRKARDEIELLNKESDVLKARKETYQEKLEEYNARIKEVEQEMENNRDICKVYESEHTKIKEDPDRIRKQAEKFENAVRALQEAQKEKVAAIEGANEQAREINREAKELDESRGKKQMRLQLMTESSKITDQSCEETKKRLQKESDTYKDMQLKRASLDQELDEFNAHNRHAQQEVTSHQKQFERLKRRYRQTLSHKDSVTETLPPLEVNKKELEKTTKLQEEDIKRQRKLLEDIQAEVDLFIGAFLKQESLEKDKKEEFEAICQQMEEMQKELKNLKAEEQHWAAHFKTLASHREKLARDASQAHRLYRETADEVAMKELEEQDLKKKHQEISQKQKEFCTMYEVVKNERNKYMTHIQKSDQHLSEMKEKFKILSNEVEILRMESAFKDKQLAKIKQEALKLEAAHDQLQNDKTRISAQGTGLNEQVEQFVIEIDKLNSIITAIEKEMVELRLKYEQAVETRNFTGTQLIDRNDELCILWEKANIQEKLLKKGEDAMQRKEEEIRSLKIDLAEVHRQLSVVRGKIPEVPKLAEEVVRLREQVNNVRKHSDDLSRELENPKSSLRKWRQLGGEDLDQETLRVKIQDLQERLNDKKESLLEKELILEEDGCTRC
ncbi:unnamed protein product [Effrenium voratum]|uniref:Cilia- and flagella-associated protein 58 central coiled coil domain-containing protein n=1 Tax=Effrenium voratum TaxID=2562239 RepID=A0AA36N607_9DINO|nr:unnamed protein product [Effrenium voratum]